MSEFTKEELKEIHFLAQDSMATRDAMKEVRSKAEWLRAHPLEVHCPNSITMKNMMFAKYRVVDIDYATSTLRLQYLEESE